MDKQEPIKINGTYNPTSRRGPRLELIGPFNRKSIDEVIQLVNYQGHAPYAFSPEYDKGRGGAIFLVDDERGASELVRNLNNKLLEYGFVISYDGPHETKPLTP
jgi:hypothetical protein